MPRAHLITALVALAAIAAGLGGMGMSGATFTAGSSTRDTVRAASDWTAPTVALADPGSPLRGTVTVSATAADDAGGSGVGRVLVQAAPTGSTQWATLCTVSAAPYTCTVDTRTLADGAHDLRAVATDVAGNSRASAIVARRVVDNNAPKVTFADVGDFGRGTMSLSAEAADDGTGVVSVRFERMPTGGSTWTTICTRTAAPFGCAFVTGASATPDGYYDLRAVATDGAGNVTAVVQSDVLIDNALPTASLSVPGSPVRGVVTLATTAGDPGVDASGVASATVQVAPAGTGQWITACTTTASPWSCRWDSSSQKDGAYELRSLVRDAAGNTGVSAVVSRSIDNTVSSVAMEDPGAHLRASVTLQASVVSPAAGATADIQIAPSGTTTWTTVCTLTAAPWSCSFDTTTRSDGAYDLRAVLREGTSTKTSAIVASRVIDNTLVRGVDVQAENRSGLTPGRIEAGDAMVLTFSELIAPGSVLAGWAGTAPQSIAVRVRDGALAGGSSTADALDIFTDATLRTRVRLGSIELNGDFVRSGKTAVFTASLASTPAGQRGAFTVTLTGVASGANVLRNAKALGTMVWSPSAGLTDLAGNPSSTAPVTETGTADRDF